MTLMTDRIELWRAPLVDGPLSRHRDWGAAVRIAAVLGSVQPDTAARTQVVNESSPMVGRAYLPAYMAVRQGDRIRCGSDWYEVIENPEEWRVGSRAHVRTVVQEVADDG
ncbi:hypothetical protein [Yinghuangia sp. YIM S09857]|uniref:hypothetical protein n=1 Tax=Yinghuangia sp. YIM S09857 TaxID=3436929 RepID=UPI003F5365BC